ncbi:MAG: TrkA family potassium uptake protein [Spirochaetes bacterium]|uniref:TrkA family potassium uptake protein n=1 Tax=Candidatus Ornithospirochaeta stercoripullorum TaxID=2840899 RepID=A0A9D9H659_9SPIO|nr:TrkA family potassium uptake protein [Candidatus Ornithospirochaeta stercoripullorum]
MKRNKEGSQVFGVIGTGRFGLAVAEELLARGKYVIAIDQDQQRLKSLYETDAEVFVISDISRESLMDAGIQDADTVIVGIGKDVESSILAALNSIELGVKHVICKVISDDHAKILKKIGADVVFPEVEIGRRTAIRLCEKLAEDILPLSEEFSIIQIRTPKELDGKSVKDIKIRERFGITLIAVVKEGKANGSVGPDTVLHEDELMVLSGSNKDLDKFQTSIAR